mgnify:CR=1 FL=1
MGFFDFMTQEIAIDLGTANTLIIHNDKVVALVHNADGRRSDRRLMSMNAVCDELIVLKNKLWRYHSPIHSDQAALDRSLVVLLGVCPKLSRKDIQQRPANPSAFCVALKPIKVRRHPPVRCLQPHACTHA